MRNLIPGPKFSVLLAVLHLITLAVWPIGYAKAEEKPFGGSQTERKNSEEKVSIKTQRSTNSAEQTEEKSPCYKKWETGTDLFEDDDDFYSSQLDPSGLETYEEDGYGYDDDEYDHFNYNRYENGQNKLNRDINMNNQEEQNSITRKKTGNVVVPEATTIELLGFQAKNLNPIEDNTQHSKENNKAIQSVMKKHPSLKKSEEKDISSIDITKKKNFEIQKSEKENSNDKNMGNTKFSADKTPETNTENGGNKIEKGKISESNSQTDIPNLKEEEEEVQISKGKENCIRDGKNNAKMLEKDLKVDEVKIQSEEDKMKNDKVIEENLSGEKVNSAKDESNVKNLYRFSENSIGNEYKDNVDDPVIADDEKGFDDNELTLAGLRDNRNELPYQYSRGVRYLKKKEIERRMPGIRSSSKSKNNEMENNSKEPFHLDFPMAEIENTDYHRNFIKSLKKFKNKDESAGILSQGDTPSPYADKFKTRLAAKVIEEEQRKRRSRLRRLKPNPMFFKNRNREEEEEQEEEEVNGYDYDTPARINEGVYRRNIFADGDNHSRKTYRRRGNNQFEHEDMKNFKIKREDEMGFYSDKRKTQGKSGWIGGENSQHKKKLKGLSEEQGRSSYVLLRSKDNGQQTVKTLVNGRSKNEESLDTDDLARLLSRDSNYVVLKKVSGKESFTDTERSRSGFGDRKKEKYKISDVLVNENHIGNSDFGKSTGKFKDRMVKGKESRAEELTDLFKNDIQDKDLEEKREFLAMDMNKRLNLYQKGEPDKKELYKPSLSQVYRHLNDFDESITSKDQTVEITNSRDGKNEKVVLHRFNPERLIKSYKKDGKEFLEVNKLFNGRSQDSTEQNNGMGNAAAPTNGNVLGMNQNGMSSAGAYSIPGFTFQENKVPNMENTNEKNGKYDIYGSENSFVTPEHAIKVLQSNFSLNPGSPYYGHNYNALSGQTYNKMKNLQNKKGQYFSDAENQFSVTRQKLYDTGKNQDCRANEYQLMGTNAAESYKTLVKNDESSSNLERFIRDFQDFSQASYPNSYKSTDLQGMSMQELTAHGGKHLQRLSNLLKEIINNNNQDETKIKNIKRGMFQKYKDQKSNWQLPEKAEDEQVRSGKWTSVASDDSNQMNYSDDKCLASAEEFLKDRNLNGKNPSARLNKDILSSKRVKRYSGYDSKDSTKMLEQKVMSTPNSIQQKLVVPNNVENPSSNQNHQQKSPSRVCLNLPPEKIMDLLSFFRSEKEELAKEEMTTDCLCRRQVPAEEKPSRRKLMSLSELDKKNSECIRKSFESYLDPLVRKMEEYEMKMKEEKKRQKREIELDESMPNDFHNFLVTSLREFGSHKREVIKKDESFRNSEESILGKRDTSGSSKNKKKSVSNEDETNIRIKIVDGNGKLDPKSSEEEEELSKDTKVAKSKEDNKVHEVYLIANDDSNKRKKKKYASIRTVNSEQSPQKQPILNHLPQVETVYNPSPGNNKAQMEKIINGHIQMKGKNIMSPSLSNVSTLDEDDIIRNNILTGNINTFTYQEKEDPTPHPLEDEKNSLSNEFEMINSKNLPRSKSFNNNFFDRYTSSGLTNSNPDIIYKDEVSQQYPNSKSIGEKPICRTNSEIRELNDNENAERYRKEYVERESAYAEYDDGIDEQGYEQEDSEDYPRPQEHLDPKMVAMWKEYVSTHLSPERHKEAMEREFQEAYLRSSGLSGFEGGIMNQIPDLGMDLNDFDQLKVREKLMKRVTSGTKLMTPIGQRFFCSFKSELPDEAYYSINPTNNKNAKFGGFINQQQGIDFQNLGNQNNLQRTRIKRSEDGVKSMNKRQSSSGHSAENNYRKYHKKNLNERPEETEEEERIKRNSIADFQKADMMRRSEAEKKIRSKVKGLSFDLTVNEIPLIDSLSEEDISFQDLLLRLQEEEKKSKTAEPNSYANNQQQRQMQQKDFMKNASPDVYKTYEIKRGRRENGENSLSLVDMEAALKNYKDKVFLKKTSPRKVKKYSEEGFEAITPYSRFIEKSSFRSEMDKDEPLRVSPVEKENSPNSINRKLGNENSKSVNSGVDYGQQKYQKMCHGFSHEAPLLTRNSPLQSPEIFKALKDHPLNDFPLATQSTNNQVDDQEKSQQNLNKESKEPVISALLVLTKREKQSQQSAEEKFPSVGEEPKKLFKTKKKRAVWLRNGEESFYFRPKGQSTEIVNEEGISQSCGCKSPPKPSKIKMVCHKKQLNCPFNQMHNDRSGGTKGSRNPGGLFLESILGRVESNPQFRKVIGPALKWQTSKCNELSENLCDREVECPNRCVFVQQMRAILARFMDDIENLASQNFCTKVCNKLDSTSSKFLQELLSFPVESIGSCRQRMYLGSILAESAGSPRSNKAEEIICTYDEVNKGRGVVARLLEESRRQPDTEKENVKIRSQYLNHKINSLNRPFLLDEGLSDDRYKKRINPAMKRGAGKENSKLASKTVRRAKEKPSLVTVSNSRLNKENMNNMKNSFKLVKPETFLLSTRKDSINACSSKIKRKKLITEPKLKNKSNHPEGTIEELVNLGYGSPGGLQQSLRSYEPWMSNLNICKGKPVNN